MIPLAQLIAAEARQSFNFSGPDWWQLSSAETVVFAIEPDRLPLMVAAWGAYEAFKDITSGTQWDTEYGQAIDAAKTAQPQLATEDYGSAGWSHFAAVFSDLSMCECWQWWAKYEAWQARNGILSWTDGSQLD